MGYSMGKTSYFYWNLGSLCDLESDNEFWVWIGKWFEFAVGLDYWIDHEI